MPFPTVLQIVQECAYELIRDPLTTLVGNPTSDARLLLQCLNRQGRDLAGKGEYGWTILQRLHSFNTVASTEEYDLPSDYARHIMSTAWDRTQLTQMYGPVNPATWQTIKSGLLGLGTISSRWRIQRGSSTLARKFYVDPIPSSVVNLVYEYISNGWCAASDLSSVKEDVTADNDVVILDRDLMLMGIKWRWRQAHGHNIIADLAEYNERLDEAIAKDKNSPTISLVGPTYSSEGSPPMLGWNNIPDQGYG